MRGVILISMLMNLHYWHKSGYCELLEQLPGDRTFRIRNSKLDDVVRKENTSLTVTYCWGIITVSTNLGFNIKRLGLKPSCKFFLFINLIFI